MAGNFWESSHCKEWLMDRVKLRTLCQMDASQFDDVAEYQKLMILFATYIQDLGEELAMTQQVISTAIVYLRRFYCYNSLKVVDPFLLAPTSMYLSSKVDPESFGVVQIEDLLGEWNGLTRERFNTNYDYQPANIIEWEYILMKKLNFSLIVHHPYDPLIQYITNRGLENTALLPTARKIINDVYLGDVVLIYPPDLIALAAISISATSCMIDVTTLFTELSVDVTEAVASIMDFYSLWRSFDEWEDSMELLANMPKCKVFLLMDP